MGKLNLKLMQGIEDAEGQLTRDSRTQEAVIYGDNNRNISRGKITNEDDDGIFRTARKVGESQTPTGHKEKIQKNGNDKSVSDIKPRKQVFSFRALVSDINIWKAYATAAGQTMEHMGAEAMNEYISRHKLAGAEQDIFAALIARNEERVE